MPGIIGGVGYDYARWKALEDRFRSIWGSCESLQKDNLFMAAHSFSSAAPSMYESKEGWPFAVDGEFALYKHAANFVRCGTPSLFRADRHRMLLTVHCKGNCALFLPSEKVLHLATDDTAAFPLYFAKTQAGILFSSHLNPLARAIQAEPDPVGVIAWMQLAQSNQGRTPFRGIRRLQPGQALTYDANSNTYHVYESSRAWTRLTRNRKQLVQLLWDNLSGAIDRSLATDYPHAIMCSGGWDSRLLVAAITSKSRNASVLGYFHGNPKSRELTITAEITKMRQLALRIEREDPEAYLVDSLITNFPRTENVLFPNWLRAGIVLREAGVQSVSAGTLGEVAGGHYGPTMVYDGWRKAAHVGSHLLNVDEFIPASLGIDLNSFESVIDAVRVRHLKRPWYIDPEYWEAIDPVLPQINADIESDLRRIQNRGVLTIDQLIEAYITETRGCQWISQQLLSCRTALDVINIYGDRELYELASSIPYRFKIQNKLTQAVLREHAPLMLKPSTAATFVPASTPLMLQEGTRLVRRLYDDAVIKLRVLSKGPLEGISSGWLDYEFMRDGTILRAVADSLRIEFLNRKAINELIDKISRYEYEYNLWNATQTILRLVNVDLMLR